MQRIRARSGDLVVLSPRERAVLGRLIRGRENKEIGYELQISPHTVGIHLGHLMEGLRLHNRVELCAWALSHPLALAGYVVSRPLHPDGCRCGSPYCCALHLIERAV